MKQQLVIATPRACVYDSNGSTDRLPRSIEPDRSQTVKGPEVADMIVIQPMVGGKSTEFFSAAFDVARQTFIRNLAEFSGNAAIPADVRADEINATCGAINQIAILAGVR